MDRRNKPIQKKTNTKAKGDLFDQCLKNNELQSENYENYDNYYYNEYNNKYNIFRENENQTKEKYVGYEDVNYQQGWYSNNNYYQNYSKQYDPNNYTPNPPKKIKNKKTNYSSYQKQEYTNKDISHIINQKENLRHYLEKSHIEVPELTKKLINELIENKIECLICNEGIDKSAETWDCEKCYTIYHNKCMYDWIFKLNATDSNKALEVYKWTCPHCNNNNQALIDNLPVYNCFCKKYYEAQQKGLKDFNPKLIPHGCGLNCGKVICKHLTCNIPCHPGPHISCQVIDKVKCFCGKVEKDIPCQTKEKGYSCETPCGKAISCNRHKCKQICHEGECDSFFKNKKCTECIVESKNKFYTFLKQLETKIVQETQEQVNLADSLSEYIFHGTMMCKKHSVEPNTDNNLKFLVKLLQISGNKLVENIKKFIPVCKETVENSCDCKSKFVKTECYKLNYSDDLLKFLNIYSQKENKMNKCTKVCKSFKNCKNHRCTKVCCELVGKNIHNYSIEDPLGNHLCLIECGKMLNCGNHKCESFCHRGNCKTCPNIIREGVLYCDCSRTKIEAPYPCGSQVECKYPCFKVRECEHKCKFTCHKDECSYCDELTFKVCKCKKNIINNIQCGTKVKPSCAVPCGEMLPCGAHFCPIICHEHTEQFDINYFCAMACGRELKCGHKCAKRCHGEDECKELDCEVSIKISCRCKVNTRNIKCGEYKKLYYENNEEYFLPCIEECKKQERLRKIETAFDDLMKLADEKHKKMFPKLNVEENQSNYQQNEIEKSAHKIVDVKFEPRMISFAKGRIKFIIELENTIEKALRNLSIKQEISRLDKKLFAPLGEFLKSYYNIKIDKVKKGTDTLSTLILSDCSKAYLPKYRISLFALLFKHHKFGEIESKKKEKQVIYHPFEMTIFIQNYRYSVSIEEVEMFISQFTNGSKHDFYVDEVTKGTCYVHFFDSDKGKKVFTHVKNKPSQFQDCYEIYYDSNFTDHLKFDELYKYLKNEEYFNFLNYKDEIDFIECSQKDIPNTNESESEEEDGFVKVGKKGKFK